MSIAHSRGVIRKTKKNTLLKVFIFHPGLQRCSLAPLIIPPKKPSLDVQKVAYYSSALLKLRLCWSQNLAGGVITDLEEVSVALCGLTEG